jgi:SOS-response transcriptional repressor LexA
MIRISGDSMEDADMPDGAYAVINPSEVVHSGDAAMCQYGAFRDVALKWVYFMPDGAIELRSATPGYPVMRYEKDSEKFEYEPLVIIGKVTATVGRPKRG